MISSAQAAELRSVRGEILVSSGTGYRVIDGPVQVKLGDAVMANPQALGRLTFADGCSMDVVPGAIIWVRSRSPCSAAVDPPPHRDPEPALAPRVVFDPAWLVGAAVLIDGRRLPAGP